MMRLPDWEERLHAFLDANAERPFTWGEWDCALAVAGVVEALTGEDFAAPFRGQYSTARGAARALRQHGDGTLIRTITAALGPPVHPAHAQRGDIVMARGNAGVCVGAHALVTGADPGGAHGFVRIPRAVWQRAWRV